MRGWKCSWLGCRRADLSHLRTSAPVAPSGNKLASPIEDSARDERDRASARAGRQTVDVATSRLTRARRGVRERARARVQTRGAWCERSLVDFRWAVKSTSTDGLPRTDAKERTLRGSIDPRLGPRLVPRSRRVFNPARARAWGHALASHVTQRPTHLGRIRRPRLSHDHDAQQRLARLAGRGDPGRIRTTAADGEVLGGLRGLEGTRPKP